jgi:hypothetical protein
MYLSACLCLILNTVPGFSLNFVGGGNTKNCALISTLVQIYPIQPLLYLKIGLDVVIYSRIVHHKEDWYITQNQDLHCLCILFFSVSYI